MSGFSAAARGVKWMLLAQFLTSGGQFFYAALTARVFSPSVFGAFAAGLSLLGLITLLTTTGLPSFILRSESLSGRSALRVRWLAIAGGAAAAAVFLVAVVPWLHLLQAEAGYVFIPLLAIAQGLGPIAAVESALLRREAVPRHDALCLVGAFVVANGLGAVVLLTNRSSWTLALATATYPAILYILCRFTNSSPTFSGHEDSTPGLFAFSRKITTQNLAFLVLQQAPSWLTSARAGTESLGQFSRAATLTGMPSTAVSTAINRALQPHWRKLNDREGADRAIREAAVLASALSFPLFGLLIAHAHTITLLWLGPGWSTTAFLVPLLAVSYGLSIPFTVVANSAEMRGVFRPVRIAQASMAVALLPCLVALYQSGDPMWAAGAMALSQTSGLITLLVSMPWCHRSSMRSSLWGVGMQLVLASGTTALGGLASLAAATFALDLFGSQDAAQLLLGTLVSALAWLLVFRWNEAKHIWARRGIESSRPRQVADPA